MPSITFGNALQHYFVSRFRNLSAARRKKLNAIKNDSDARNYVKTVREKIKSLVQLPDQFPPLDPQITGTTTFPGFIMEKILFKSRENYTVSGNFYLPEAGVTKRPAVLYLCGHAHNGKGSTMYQSFCQSLAMRGFAVLIVDPIGQGERKMYPPSYPPTKQHTIAGKQLLLTGDDLFSWRICDAMRSVDYLLTRPEADPERIFICGESGGGTLSTWMAACEDRAAGFVISSAVTTWLRNVENEVAVDIEQIPPGAAAAGLDFADFLIAAAPKPMLILGGKKDFFDPRGFFEINDQLRKFYELLGAPERLDSLMGEDYHGIYQPLRERGYEFLCRMAGVPNPWKEEKNVIINKEEDLYAAPGGSVYNIPGERKIFEFAAAKADELRVKRAPLSRKALGAQLKKVLGIKKVSAPCFRKLSYRYYTCDGSFQNYSRFGLETEPGEVMAIIHRSAQKTLFYNFEDVPGETRLYIPHEDSADELRVREPAPGDALYSLDCRGVGETLSTACDQMPELDPYYYYGINYHFPSLHMLFGEEMCGRRVQEILSALKLIAPRSSNGKVVLEAKGHGCIYALLVAVISPDISEVQLENCPASWESLVKDPLPPCEATPLSILPRNILALTDIPEILRTLKKAGVAVTVR